MERKEAERRTQSILDDYSRTKQLYLDVIHESDRTKDDQYTRVLAFHETQVALLTKRIGGLLRSIEELRNRISDRNHDDEELVEMINALNRVALHAMLGPGATAAVDVSHDVAITVESSPLDADCKAPRESVEADAQSAQHVLRSTVARQQDEISLLRFALSHIVGRVRESLEIKTNDAVEEILRDARSHLAAVQEAKTDPFLMQSVEQRRQDLAAISNAQKEIERLNHEKAALVTSLRKSEQDVVQMRLKVMERDSSMAIISMRIKAVERQLLEETSNSGKRIEDAEKLAGEITVKYETEVRRLRQIIVDNKKEKKDLLRQIDEERNLVTVARGETQEAIGRIEAARVEGYDRGRAELLPTIAELEESVRMLEKVRDELVQNLAMRSQQLEESRTNVESLQTEIEQLNEKLTEVVQALDETQQELELRMQSPFGMIPPRTPASREQSENGILTVNNLIEDIVERTANDPAQAESGIRRLSARLAKVHQWSRKSDKAKHPSVAARVSTTIHDLAAGMLAVATASGAVPPTPTMEKRRASSKDGDRGLPPLAGARAGSFRSRGTSDLEDRASLGSDTVVLAGGFASRAKRKEKLGAASAALPPGTAQSQEGTEISHTDASEMSTVTPSSSEDEGDDDDVFHPKIPQATVGCMCAPEMVSKAIQADGLGKRTEVQGSNLKRTSTKLLRKEAVVDTSHVAKGGASSPTASKDGGDSQRSPLVSVRHPHPDFVGSPLRGTAAGDDEADFDLQGFVVDGSTSPTVALVVLEYDVRQHIENGWWRIVLAMQNRFREGFADHRSQQLRRRSSVRVDALRGSSNFDVAAFAQLKAVEISEITSAADQEVGVGGSRGLGAPAGIPPAEKENVLEAIGYVSQAVEVPAEVGDEQTSVDSTLYNECVRRLRQASEEIEKLGKLKNSLGATVQLLEGQLQTVFDVMDDGGKQTINVASQLFLQPRGAVEGGGSSHTRLGQVSSAAAESGEPLRMLLETVNWFLLESQRLVAKSFLPAGLPVAFEGRPLQSTAQAQEKLSALLDGLRGQKAFLVAHRKRGGKKQRKDGGSETPTFLSSPEMKDLEVEAVKQVQLDAEEDELEPLDENPLAKKVFARSPRKDVHLIPLEDRVDAGKESSDDEASTDNEVEEGSAFVPPVVPRLKIPVNPSVQKLELEALVQPLLRVLHKKLAGLGLSVLLDEHQRTGTALELEGALDDVSELQLLSVTDVRRAGLRALLSYESAVYLRDSTQYSALHAMCAAFPKHVLQKCTTDFSAEMAFQLILLLTEWWDSWSRYMAATQEAIQGRKTDILRRLIEIAENLEALESDTSREAITAAASAPGEVSVEALASKAQRRDRSLARSLDHPSVASFSLNAKSKVFLHSRDAHRAHRALPWKRGGEVNPLMVALAEVSDAACHDVDSRTHAHLERTAPLPTVATLSPPPQWNGNAKKPSGKWDSAKLPPLK